MLHIKTKRLEICTDNNIEISELDHYTCGYSLLESLDLL